MSCQQKYQKIVQQNKKLSYQIQRANKNNQNKNNLDKFNLDIKVRNAN